MRSTGWCARRPSGAWDRAASQSGAPESNGPDSIGPDSIGPESIGPDSTGPESREAPRLPREDAGPRCVVAQRVAQVLAAPGLPYSPLVPIWVLASHHAPALSFAASDVGATASSLEYPAGASMATMT